MVRFALYYAPQSGTHLAEAASKWLGRDNVSLDCNQLKPLKLDSQRFQELIRVPYHYGFHGTLKPPFSIRESVSQKQILDELKTFCSRRKPFIIDALEIAWIGKFLCLRPVRPVAQLDMLAGDTVQEFDRFRIQMGQGELDKRRSKDLTPAQENLLLQWGYPYVFEEFRFHLTLSSNVEIPEERSKLEDEARLHFHSKLLSDIPVEGVSLFLESKGEPMTQLKFIPFCG